MQTVDLNSNSEALRLSEERFRQLVQGARDYAIVMLDPHGNVASWNTGAELINGYSEAEIIGKSFVTFYPPADVAANAPAAQLAQAMAEGRVEVDGWRQRKDKSLFWANVVITRLQDDSGHLTGFSKVTRDVTERRKSETQLYESEARMRAILATAVDAIITIDEFGTIESLNPATEKLFGYTAEEMIGQNVKMLMPQPYRQDHDGYLNNYTTTGQKKIIGIGREVTGLRKNGETFPMDLAVSEVAMGGRRLFTGIVRDITERKKSESQLVSAATALRQRNEDLLRSNQELDSFAYIASHDLKEPLRGIHNYATFLIRLRGRPAPSHRARPQDQPGAIRAIRSGQRHRHP